MQPPATPPVPVSGGIDPIVIGIAGAVLFVLLVGFVLYMRWQHHAYGSRKRKD